MFLFLLVLSVILIYVIIWLYCKLTTGICKCSRHLVGKVVIITGGNGGIGFETAKNLADRGARVILACRNEKRGIEARDRIIKYTGNEAVHYMYVDLASLSSVRKFAKDFLEKETRLDILINNAGVFGSDNGKTEDGLLLGMQTNHFGPFLLTILLLPLLKSSAPSRIINVSSIAHTAGVIDFKNLNGENETETTYKKRKIYSNSKLCNILMAIELSERLKGAGVTANSLHPGVVQTEILYDINVPIFQWLLPLIKLCAKSSWEGAQTSIYLAVSPEVNDVSGKYFVDCRIKNLSKHAQNRQVAEKLWEISEKYVGWNKNKSD